jgi:Ser/Thr protein kinase RdoA (MazF antagonist)
VRVSDAELCDAAGWPAVKLVRQRWPRSSSAPMELVSRDGDRPWLLKDLGARRRASRPSFLVDPGREREAYDVLPAELGAPRRRAAGRAWLLLELVDGVPLTEAYGLDAWEAAARWLARLHATPVPHARCLLHRDEAHLLLWLRRALAFAPAGSLAAVEPVARAAVARLAALPAVLVHGEAYPSNLLVEASADGPHIRPVDWETYGTGAGALDLAALTSGTWEPSKRARVVAAYREASGGGPSGRELEAARLAVALQWLGWSPSWTPPPAQRHDWLGEAVRAARALA